MKILASGDIHGDTMLAEKLAEKAEREGVDLVILCGDLTYFDSSTDNLIGPFVKRKQNVVFVPGNHETLATGDFLAEMYNIKNIHGYAIKIGDVGIFGAGGSTEVGPNLKISNNEMIKLLEQGFQRIKDAPKKIMVTHEHPAGTKMEKFTRFFKGSDAIREAIDRFSPDLLLCSHVHEAEGIEEKISNTRIINVGKSGKIIEF